MATCGPSGLLVAARKRTLGVELVLFKGCEKVGGPSLLACHEMGSSRRQEGDSLARAPLAGASLGGAKWPFGLGSTVLHCMEQHPIWGVKFHVCLRISVVLKKKNHA